MSNKLPQLPSTKVLHEQQAGQITPVVGITQGYSSTNASQQSQVPRSLSCSFLRLFILIGLDSARFVQIQRGQHIVTMRVSTGKHNTYVGFRILNIECEKGLTVLVLHPALSHSNHLQLRASFQRIFRKYHLILNEVRIVFFFLCLVSFVGCEHIALKLTTLPRQQDTALLPRHTYGSMNTSAAVVLSDECQLRGRFSHPRIQNPPIVSQTRKSNGRKIWQFYGSTVPGFNMMNCRDCPYRS